MPNCSAAGRPRSASAPGWSTCAATAEAKPRQRPAPLPVRLTAAERAAHAAFVATLGPGAIWLSYAADSAPAQAAAG